MRQKVVGFFPLLCITIMSTGVDGAACGKLEIGEKGCLNLFWKMFPSIVFFVCP